MPIVLLSTICCIPTILHCLISKQLLRPTWLPGIKAEAEPHQMGKTGSKRKYQYQFKPNHLPLHLPEFQSSRKRCEYCYKEGFERKTFVKCTECRVFLCLVKKKKLFHETSFLLKMILFYHIFPYLIYCDFIYTVENKILWDHEKHWILLCFICYVPPTLLQANRLFVTFDSCLK